MAVIWATCRACVVEKGGSAISVDSTLEGDALEKAHEHLVEEHEAPEDSTVKVDTERDGMTEFFAPELTP